MGIFGHHWKGCAVRYEHYHAEHSWSRIAKTHIGSYLVEWFLNATLPLDASGWGAPRCRRRTPLPRRRGGSQARSPTPEGGMPHTSPHTLNTVPPEPGMRQLSTARSSASRTVVLRKSRSTSRSAATALHHSGWATMLWVLKPFCGSNLSSIPQNGQTNLRERGPENESIALQVLSLPYPNVSGQ